MAYVIMAIKTGGYKTMRCPECGSIETYEDECSNIDCSECGMLYLTCETCGYDEHYECTEEE